MNRCSFKNCLVALTILLGWLAIESLSGLLTGNGRDVYYPLRSGRHPGWIRDWTEHSLSGRGTLGELNF